MTGNIEKRIESLETRASRADHNLQLVIAEIGETADQALTRLGVEPDDGNVLVVVFSEAQSHGSQVAADKHSASLTGTKSN